MSTLLKPSSLLPKGMRIQQINHLTLFKFTDELGDKQQEISINNQKTELFSSGTQHGTPEHYATINNNVQEMINSGQYKEIYVNKALSTSVNSGSQIRPDIVGIRYNGKTDVIEVISPSQTAEELQNKIKEDIIPNFTSKKIIVGKTKVLEIGESFIIE